MLLLGDCNHWLKEIKDESIDLIVTDPPYGIEFMGKDWDKALVNAETWKECFRVLKEGKLAFVMCSPRQDVLSRMIVNLQDAGFRTNYTSIYWTFASGFPKAANVSKLIDKKAGATREVIGEYEHPLRSNRSYISKPIKTQGYKPDRIPPPLYEKLPLTKPATEAAKAMEGAYVGFQPKPAVEVILVVSKGKTLTWLDDCRIPYQSEHDWFEATGDGNTVPPNTFCFGNKATIKRVQRDSLSEKGRFPANLLVEDDVLNDGSIHKSGKFTSEHKARNIRSVYGDYKGEVEYLYKGDEGSYSRYFSLDAWAKTFPFLIVPKASASERNKGLEGQPLKQKQGDRPNSPDSTGKFPEHDHRIIGANFHATVKPLKLMSYLITMGSREGDLVLDPFCGSGTVCIAAHQLHRKWLGIEMNPEYAEIIKKRLADPLAQLKLTVFD